MRRAAWSVAAAAAAAVWATAAATARGQVTRVATFENFAEGAFFYPPFTDPLSGITFRDPRAAAGFGIDYSDQLFGGGNFLTGNLAEPGPGWIRVGGFGFTADLPQPAYRVSLDVEYSRLPSSTFWLEGLDAGGAVVARGGLRPIAQGGEGRETVAVETPEAVMAGFRVVTDVGVHGAIVAGYDNVSYTVVPEPGVGEVVLGAATGLLAGRRRGRRGGG